MLSSSRLTGFRSLIAAMAVALASAAQSAASNFGSNTRVSTRSPFDDSPFPDTRYRKHKPVSGFAAAKRASAKRRGVLRNRRAHR